MGMESILTHEGLAAVAGGIGILLAIGAYRLQRHFSLSQDAIAELVSMLKGRVQGGDAPSPFEIPRRYRNLPCLVSAIETADEELSGRAWGMLKRQLIHCDVLPKARRWASSLYVQKRFWAMRGMFLDPEVIDEPIILAHLADKLPKTRVLAALCAVKLGTADSVNAVLDALYREPPEFRCFFREALLRGDHRIAIVVEERVKKISSHENREILDELLMSFRNSHVPITVTD